MIVIALNFMMPRIGEDFALSVPYSQHQASWIEKTSQIYTKIVLHSNGWNARLGEQLAILILSFNKTIFNVLNIFVTLIYCFLVLIYAKGDFPKIDFKTSYIYLVTFSIFFLIPKSGDLFLWTSVATNYLWSSFILLFFLLPYRMWLSGRDLFINKPKVIFVFFALIAIFAGMTNENTVIAVIGMIIFGYFFSKNKIKKTISHPKWYWFGLFFLIIGYSYLLLSPSTKMRRDYYLQAYGIQSQGVLDYILRVPEIINQFLVNSKNILIFLVLISLLYIVLQKKKFLELNQENKNNFFVIIYFVLLSFASVAALVFVPYFESRSLLLNWFFLLVLIGNFMFQIFPLKRTIILISLPFVIFGFINISKLCDCTFNLSQESQVRQLSIMNQIDSGSSVIFIDRYKTSCPNFFSDREDWLISFHHDEVYYGVEEIKIINP